MSFGANQMQVGMMSSIKSEKISKDQVSNIPFETRDLKVALKQHIGKVDAFHKEKERSLSSRKRTSVYIGKDKWNN